jgi:predicted PolB exonuclease-like 3'-5' exonuclease
MKHIVIDIETLPSGEYSSPEDIKAPANYKDPEKIMEYQKSRIEEEFRKRALIPHKCNVCSIALKSNSFETSIYAQEEDCIRWLEESLSSHSNSPYEIVLVGVNIRSFDIIILKQRAWKYKSEFLSVAMSQKIVDLMDLFTGSKYKDYLVSKDEMCKFFDIPVEGDSGSQVYDWFLQGKFKDIQEHCLNDVRKEYELFQRMSL